MKKILKMICHPRVGGDLLAVLFVFLAACTDYVQQIDDRDGEWDRFVPSTMTDSRDGKTYKTVVIGSLTWMAENLNYKTENSKCYNDNASNCGKYGRLYTWVAAKNTCPDGWHLPAQTEWRDLFDAVGGSSTAGKVLKSTSSWNSKGNGLDSYRFSALPGGRRYYGYYDYEGVYGYFWSSTEETPCCAYFMCLDYNYNGVSLRADDKDVFFSVRCVKDEVKVVEYSSNVSQQSSSSSTSVSSSSIASSSSMAERELCNEETDDDCIKDSRDGQTYKTVTIGTQTWMAENLNYQTANSYCYNDNASNCTKYGRLYTWAAAMDSVGTWSANGKGCGYGKTCSPTYPVCGVCPEGWHLPTQAEWNTLFTAVGGESTAGKMLKSTSGWNSSGNGTDAYSFSALPAGYRDDNGDYVSEGGYADFWSSTGYYSDDAYYVDLDYSHDYAYLFYSLKYYGFSVRCVKDENDGDESSSSVTSQSNSSSTSVSNSSIASSSSMAERELCNEETDNDCIKDSRDGQTYKTVSIGSQVWMAENLNVKMEGSMCYGNDESNCETYGRFYGWDAARKACLAGWHLPSKQEFETLFDEVGGQSMAGKMLKSVSGWNDYDGKNGNGTDTFSFAALPAGGMDYYNRYYGEGVSANFWTSSEYSYPHAYYVNLYRADDGAGLRYQEGGAFSVRCVKDD